MVQLASWVHTIFTKEKQKIFIVCVCVRIHTYIYFFLFFFKCNFLTSQNNFLKTLAADICMDFSIAGCVKGDRLFVFTPEKNWNRLFLSKVGRDMWQRGPAHLYRQTCCRLTQIDHQLGSKSFRCRFTITLALCCSADHQWQIDVQFSEQGAG